jgi:hypothetical protein
MEDAGSNLLFDGASQCPQDWEFILALVPPYYINVN